MRFWNYLVMVVVQLGWLIQVATCSKFQSKGTTRMLERRIGKPSFMIHGLLFMTFLSIGIYCSLTSLQTLGTESQSFDPPRA